MTTSDERVTKVTTESGASAYIADSVPLGAIEGLLGKMNASDASNLEVIRRLFGEETYLKVKANPSEAASILQARQQRGQSV